MRDATIADTMLEGFTTRQLVEELFRRIGTGKEDTEEDEYNA